MTHVKRLIIGSTAMHHWYPSFNRIPSDIDFLERAGGNVHGHDSRPLTKNKNFFAELSWHELSDYIIDRNAHPVFLDSDSLFTLKVSHAPWDIHWTKTMHDICYMQERGAELDTEMHRLLVAMWTEHHAGTRMEKHVKLKQANDEFFGTVVNRKHNHDVLHVLVADGHPPMHTKIRAEPDSPYCSEALFNNLCYADQLQCAMEEIMVIAIERFHLNSNSSSMTIVSAVQSAIKMLITTMTTGWFNTFLIMQYSNLSNVNKLQKEMVYHIKYVVKCERTYSFA